MAAQRTARILPAPFTGAMPMLETILLAALFSFLTYYVTFDL